MGNCDPVTVNIDGEPRGQRPRSGAEARDVVASRSIGQLGEELYVAAGERA